MKNKTIYNSKGAGFFLPALILITAFSLLGFFSLVQAQEQEEVKINEAPKIYADKVSVDPVKEDAKKITGKFEILSQEDKNYFDIYYEVNLYNAVQKSLTLDPGEIYNPENLRLVASEPNRDPLIIQSQETKKIDYSFNIPENHPSGTYVIGIRLYQKDVILLSEKKSSVFQLSGNNKFISISSESIVRNGRNYSPVIGIDFSQDETPEAFIISQNLSHENVSAYPETIIYDRNQFGPIIDKLKGEKIDFTQGELKNIDLKMRKVEAPGSYLARVQFFASAGDKPVSSPVYLRFIIRGESGRILELSADKPLYKKGDTMKINTAVVGSADTFIRDEEGKLIENPERLNQGKATLKISVVNMGNNKEVQEDSKEVVLSKDFQETSFEFQLDKKLLSYRAIATLEKDGKILHKRSIESSAPEAKKDSLMKRLKILVLIIVLVPIIIVILSRIKKKTSPISFLIIISVAFLGMFLANQAEATLTVSWNEPYNGKHYNFDGVCARGADSFISSSGTVSTDVCQNEGGEIYETYVYVDGILKSTIINEIHEVNSSGWFWVGRDRGIENYSVGSHTMRVRVKNRIAGTGGFVYDQTRTFYVDENVVGVIDTMAFWDDGGTYLKGLSGTNMSGAGKSCTTPSNGHCCLRPVGDVTANVTASKSGYQTRTRTPTLNPSSADPNSSVSFIMVADVPPPPPPPPSLPSCTATFSPSSITEGQSTRATWSSSNDADGQIPYSCTGGLGNGTFTTSSGSTTVSPDETQTCTLTVQNSSGTRTCNGTITVGEPGPICDSRYWNPSSATIGDSSRFYWNSTNATSAILKCSGPSPLFSTSVSVDGNRSFNFSSAGTETCTVNLSGSGGNTTCSRSITISPPDGCSWSPSGPLTVPDSSTFSWSFADAGAATLSCTGPNPMPSTRVGISGSSPFNFSSAGTEICTVSLSTPGGTEETCSRSIVINSAALPITYDLTVSATGTGTGSVANNPPGASCGANCTTYDSGTRVTLNPSPSSGSEFSSWSGCDSVVGNNCNITMNADKAVTATFDLSCTPNPSCADDTCIGDACTDGCGIQYDGTKDCSDEYDYIEVPL